MAGHRPHYKLDIATGSISELETQLLIAVISAISQKMPRPLGFLSGPPS
jgi:hypothetical protein